MISIIVPVYNSENYLFKCCESILNQDYKDFEVLLINDGSTDCSGKICDYYATIDNRFKVYHKSNSGVSSARNLGIEKSIGEFITFIDSDDYIGNNYLSTLLNYSSYDYVFGGCTIIDINNNIIDIPCTKEDIFENKTTFMNSFSSLDSSLLLDTPWGKLFHSNIIKSQNIKFDLSLKLGEDKLFNFTYLRYCNTFFMVANTFYFYRMYSDKQYILKVEERINTTNLLEESYLLLFSSNNIEVTKEKCKSYINFILYTYALSIEKAFIDKYSKDYLNSLIKNIFKRIELYKISYTDCQTWKTIFLLTFYKTRHILSPYSFYKIRFLMKRIVKIIKKS